jgi:hypothetical protein
MAKKRQGSRPSAVDPSPPPTPEIGYASDKPRCCYWCRKAAAAMLLGLSTAPVPGIFCSTDCAAAYAIDHFVQTGIVWCMRHAEWSLPSGECQSCKAEGKARAAVAASANDRLAAKESEAAHGQ